MRHCHQGDFICEYASTVLLKEDSMKDQERYKEAGLGCYCLDTRYQRKWYTFDATFTLKDPGHYTNHASNHCNLIDATYDGWQRCQAMSEGRIPSKRWNQLWRPAFWLINPGWYQVHSNWYVSISVYINLNTLWFSFGRGVYFRKW